MTSLPEEVGRAAERETWLLRTDNLVSGVMHQRYARLVGGSQARLELYSRQQNGISSPEYSIPLVKSKVTTVTSANYDVAPAGVNLLKGYLAGKIRSEEVYTFKMTTDITKPTLTEVPLLPSKESPSSFRLGFTQEQDAQDWVTHIKQLINVAQGKPAEEDASEPGDTEAAYSDDKADFELPDKAPADPSALWQSTMQWNGLSVFQEPSETGAYAVACAMKASPKTVFEHFIRLKDGTSAWNVFEGVRVLDQHPDDEHKLVFHGHIKGGSGILGIAQSSGVFAPRDVVLEQTWNFDDDEGTFGIVYKSVDHVEVPESRHQGLAQSIQNYFKPVRARIPHVGITITPLKPDYYDSRGRHPQDCPEAMVLMVVRCDLGGALDHSNRFYGLTKPVRLLWLHSFVASIAHIRDIMDQKRFVKPPFGLLHEGLKHIEEGIRSRETASVEQLWEYGQPKTFRMDADEDVMASMRSVGEVEAKSWLDDKYYSTVPGRHFQVRGKSYLQDKVKVPSPDPALRLVGLELVKSDPDDEISHVSPYLPIIMTSQASYLLPIHFKYPAEGGMMHLICVFAVDHIPSEADDAETPFTKALGTFYVGDKSEDDERRRKMLKLIPMVAEGSWIMKSTVGSTPCIIGTKLDTEFHRGDNYLETTVDISSNRIAANVTSFVCGAITSVAIDLAFVLEGKTADQLPEQVLGTVRLDHLDLKEAKQIHKGQFAAGAEKAGPAPGVEDFHEAIEAEESITSVSSSATSLRPEDSASAVNGGALRSSRSSQKASKLEANNVEDAPLDRDSMRTWPHTGQAPEAGSKRSLKSYKTPRRPIPVAFKGADLFAAGYDDMCITRTPPRTPDSSRSGGVSSKTTPLH